MAVNYASLAELVKAHESRGDYNAVNPQSGAGGAYQFVPSTWRAYGSQAGVDLGQYPTAQSAPSDVQDAVFAQAVNKRGLGDWTCPGCDPALNAYLQSNPGAANLPVFGSQAPTGLGTTVAGAGQPVVPAAAPTPTPASAAPGPNPALLQMAMGRAGNLSSMFAQAAEPMKQYYQSFFGSPTDNTQSS